MEDFNIPSAERVALLQRLQDAMGGAPPYFWAACQICDLKALEELVEAAGEYPAMVRVYATDTVQMIMHWSQRTKGASRESTPKKLDLSMSSSPFDSAAASPPRKKQKATDSPQDKAAGSPKLSRSATAVAIAKQRDNHRCVLTGSPLIQVAHIYPFFSLANTEEDMFGERHVFWDVLRTFWPQEKIGAWEAALFPRGLGEVGIETVYNLITVAGDIHNAWNRGAFALKPISENAAKTILQVQFFWQRKSKEIQATMSLLTTPFPTENLDRNEGAFEAAACEFFVEQKRIKSGDIFEIGTDDPIERPLPSFALLEMQWFLQRVMGMAGAAGPYEDWLDESFDEEGSNLGLEDPGDVSFALSDTDLPTFPDLLNTGNLLPMHDSKAYMEEREQEELQAARYC